MARTDTAAAPLTRPDGTPIRVLAVDDESSLTELLSMAMRYEGWQVTTAGTRDRAEIEVVTLNSPSVTFSLIDGRLASKRKL